MKPNTYAAFKRYCDYLAYCDDELIRDVIENGKVTITRYSGVGGDPVREILTDYDRTKTERIIKGPTNSFIILGKDRFAGKDSGYGAFGATGCAAIDIMVGHLGTRPVESIGGKPVKAGKDFKNDAARIYMSQMCDIDEYFEIPKFQTVVNKKVIDLEISRGTSGIAIKADNVRLISREGIKLVTIHGTKNSLGNEASFCGIDIIAGINVAKTYTDPMLLPQPMVKGDSLVECLKDIYSKIDELSNILAEFIDQQTTINTNLVNHSHMSGAPASISSRMIADNTQFINLLITIENIAKFLNRAVGTSISEKKYFSSVSPNYINSIYNRVN